MTKQSLGHGVHVEFDGYGVILTVEDGTEVTSTVYLDPYVIEAFWSYKKQLYKEIFNNLQTGKVNSCH